MGILTISPDSLWLCEPVGGRKRKEESGVRQGVLERRNSADGRRTRGTLTWYLATALDDEPPHGQADEDEEDEEDQGNGDRENWKRNKNAHQLKFLTADGPESERKLTQVGRGRSGAGRREDGGRLSGRRGPLSTHRVGEGGALLHLHLSGFTP